MRFVTRFLTTDVTPSGDSSKRSCSESDASYGGLSTLSGTSGASCVTFEEDCDYTSYYCASPPAKAAPECEEAAVGGLYLGMRVTTLNALAVVEGKGEYPAGMTGRVWAMSDGLVVVALDNEKVELVLVWAEERDLAADPAPLPRGTNVCGCQLVMKGRNGLVELPEDAVGEVLAYDKEVNHYVVAMWTYKKKLNIPARQLQPAPSLVKRLLRPNGLLNRLVRGRRAAAPAPLAAAERCIANLSKEPSYSNISGSPRGTYRVMFQ